MSRLTLIVAATLENGIGQNTGLPWRLPKEMAYFAKATSNAPEGKRNAVVMGRNTWESIPTKFRPLKDRVNVVISRNKEYHLYVSYYQGKFGCWSLMNVGLREGSAHLCDSLDSALTFLSNPSNFDNSIHRIFVIGGATLYDETLQLPPSTSSFVDRILLTRIQSPAFECDTFMPNFQAANSLGSTWKQSSSAELREWVGVDIANGVQEEKGVQYEFQMWVR